MTTDRFLDETQKLNLAYSVVIPVFNEGEAIVPLLEKLSQTLTSNHEVIVVFDSNSDSTLPYLLEYQKQYPALKPTLNEYGRGPALAIKSGIDGAASNNVIILMGDSSDDLSAIEVMAKMLNETEAVIVAPSRYMDGGERVGGSILKSTLSKWANLTLYHLGRVQVHDSTNAFKGYSKSFITEVGIESTNGFEMAVELVAKARHRHYMVKEIPTVWHERSEGKSNYKLIRWLPHYLKWYLYAIFGFRRKNSLVGR